METLVQTPPPGAEDRAGDLRQLLKSLGPGLITGGVVRDGLADVGSTTRMDPPAHAPVATIIQFFQRGTGRGDEFRDQYQKLYDEGIQVALKYLGE